jgi:hypothetical protein
MVTPTAVELQVHHANGCTDDRDASESSYRRKLELIKSEKQST